MIPYLVVNSLSETEIVKIHHSALRVLEQTGLAVEHQRIRELFEEYGAKVDNKAERVYFPHELVDRFIGESEPFSVSRSSCDDLDSSSPVVQSECFRPINQPGKPYLASRAGISSGYYLNPDSNRSEVFSDQTLTDYVQLARKLDERIIVRMETYPVGPARVTQPLEARLFAWKQGVFEGGSIQMTSLMPYLYDMYVVRAESLGCEIEDVFCASSYIISPLKMPKDFCDQVLYFHEKGLRVRIGNMFSMGGTAPVSLAGNLVLGLAERLAISILERCLYGDKTWVLYGEMAPLDLRTMLMLLGRPEILLFNLAVIQLGRHYQVPVQTLGGVSDAALPSAEAGMQKMLTALPCILAGGCNIDPGRLGIDTLYSPIQMILDAEMIDSLRRLIKGFDVNEEKLAVDVIDEIGPGGMFMANRHTVKHMREEIWQSEIWSGGVNHSPMNIQEKTDATRAYEKWKELMDLGPLEPQLDESIEGELEKIITKAQKEFDS